MGNIIKNENSLLDVDWTSTVGETPFYEQSSSNNSGRYCISVDTGVLSYPDLLNLEKSTLILRGTNEILEFYNKEPVFDYSLVSASIPGSSQHTNYSVEGTYIPIRPNDNIKVLVTIDEEHLNKAVDKKTELIAAYDEIQINTYGLLKKAENISKLLKKYDKESKDYEGKIYNFSFNQEATDVVNFASLLSELVISNNYEYSSDRSDLIMLGANVNYLPLYAQINQSGTFDDLPLGFSQFKKSRYVNGNTLYLYKNIDAINKLSKDIGVSTPSSETTMNTMGWEDFLHKYILYPRASVEHTTIDSHKQREKVTGGEQLKKDISSLNSQPVKDASALEKENRKLRSEELKKDLASQQKKSRDFIGDNVLGNLDKTIHQIHSLEDQYHEILDKTGMTYIVRAALRCLAIDLPIDELKGFLRDARNFTSEVMEILETPVITLDDLMPTVDIMGDILKQVFLAILEAVAKAMWSMLKNIIYTLLDNCNDPCAANFGGIQIGALLQKGGLKELGKGLVGPVLATAGSAAVGGVKNGLVSSNLNQNSKQFLSNLNKKVSPEQIKTLTTPILKSQASQISGEISSQISKSPIGKFLDEASATLTCGETNSLLQGKSSPASAKIMKSIADRLCAENPTAYSSLCELLPDQDSVNDFFGNVGALVDQDELEQIIEQAEDMFPNSSGCLTDNRDSDLRCFYLEQKSAPDWWCEAQDNESAKRSRKRINQLQDILDDPSTTLQSSIPPIYCSYDPITGKIIDGLVPNDHASFTYMMRETLGTTFDGVGNAFTYDVLKVPKALQLEVPGGGTNGASTEIIDRVISGRSEQGAVLIETVTWDTSSFSVLGLSIPIINREYKMINPAFELAVNQGFSPNPPFWKSPPVDEDGDLIEDYREKTIEYNQDKPPLIKPVTTIEFCPGMSSENGSFGVYSTFQTGHWMPFAERPDNTLARERLSTNKKSMRFSVENITKTSLKKSNGDLYSTLLNEVRKSPELREAVSNTNAGIGELLGPDGYALLLSYYSNVPTGRDKFSIIISGVYANAPQSNIYNKIFDLGIAPEATEVIESRDLDWSGQNSFSTKEKHFVKLLETTWIQGESIYSLENNIPTRVSNPDYSKNFIQQTPQDNKIKMGLLRDRLPNIGIGSLFQELSRNLMSSCLSEVGKNNQLLNKQYGNLMDLINLAPTPCASGKDLGLLGLEDIKDDVEDIYKDSLCIESSFPNVTGLGNNRDNALESAALYGLVKATIRLYSVEIVLRNLVTFNMLQASDLDPVFIAYVQEKMTKEIRNKGYLNDFVTQTIKAYNLESRRSENLPPTENYDVATEYFIRQQIIYSVEKILSVSGLESENKSIDKMLFNNNEDKLKRGWLPEFEVGKEIDFSSPTGPSGDTKIMNQPASEIQSAYHVANKSEILGIKDFYVGSIILEKYIRSEPNNNWKDSNSANDRTGVFDISSFGLFASTDNAPVGQETPIPSLELGQTTTEDSAAPRFDTVLPDAECEPFEGVSNVNPTGTGDNQTTTPGEVSPLEGEELSSSRFFDTLRYGLRLVVKTPAAGEFYRYWRDQSTDHGFELDKAKKNKSYIDDTVTKPFVPSESNKANFPIVCVEIPITGIDNVSNVSSEFFTSGYEDNFDRLIEMIKGTNEYKFLFDYCFPLKRDVSLSALYNETFVLPYPDLNNVFMATKESLRMAFLSVANSGNYKYKDLEFTQKSLSDSIANGIDIPGIDIGLIAAQFIIGIGKGIGETFSPNIAIARKIQIAIESIGPLLVKTINLAKKAANNSSTQLSKLGADVDPRPAGDPITECDLPDPPFPLPEIPIILISLGLLPMDLFFPVPGPPLGPLGFAYLGLFHSSIAPGRLVLDAGQSEKEKERCEIIKKGGPNLRTKAEECDK